MLTIIYLPASTVLNFDSFTLEIKMSNGVIIRREPKDTREKKGGGGGFSGCLQTSYMALKISVSLWLADLFSGVGEPTTY